ncbi:conserved Plasmodium protein, unknown function [Plasmodium knowlesi strain H]|uniref:Uncharacterized protein n=3 Tax=Plasmodium knowlesi TaxID=5850 RepID=A0A5K1VE01_PLAKH|nr:uncharacterized protein PKNH_0206200 [Plasmodium knowlesi strain H]OTN66233.1 Uncharacterized protein PKNOH_S09515500 [Plasmodium knowlesi]CAA9986328.1 ATP synthase-associated protein, putative [Plasmodium knowlesi strain H]SBO25570.1 conserved Plasmodium protein, unknown function [Plasmodium knowlesi strain H]SBO28312.1 conserved Plasmodium protein, unknown function [Plasmodium knowlesi strain H]VVS75802.1 ATP synthase-associated protein, putative [Plasmodium knowlesi strain H]|eukprot:XP_002257733.1 [Plasmodium knowlesi strain H]
MYRRYIWNSLFRDVNFRLKKLYHSFYYAQSHIKYVMLFLFPGVIWSTRYRADTKLGYYIYINEEKLYPNKSIEAGATSDGVGSWTDSASLLDYLYAKYFYMYNKLTKKKWKNGTKFYLDDGVTVADVKKMLYSEEEIPRNLKLGCRGRMMEDTDNLAMAVRAFCKRDPKIFIWEDEHAAYI